MQMDNSISKLAKLIKSAEKPVFFTGAGVSTDSGIPDFRSPDKGLWRATSAQEFLFIDDFKREPEKFYDFALKYFKDLLKAEPNTCHYFIAEIQKNAEESFVITQNIDNLHQKAGSDNVIELHGNFARSYCINCMHEINTTKVFNMLEKGMNPPECPLCKGLLKPDITFFGESLPEDALEKAVSVSENADLFIVLGSSLVVNPAALVPGYAKKGGAKVIILNRDETPYDSIADIVIHDKLSNIINNIKEVYDG